MILHLLLCLCLAYPLIWACLLFLAFERIFNIFFATVVNIVLAAAFYFTPPQLLLLLLTLLRLLPQLKSNYLEPYLDQCYFCVYFTPTQTDPAHLSPEQSGSSQSD